MLSVFRSLTLRTPFLLLGAVVGVISVALSAVDSVSLLAQEAAAPLTPPVRVGVVAFEDFEGEFKRWNRLFAELAKKEDSEVTFDLAVGSYGDLLHWMDKGYVDLAVLTPGVFSEYFQLGKKKQAVAEKTGFEYLATDGVPTTTSSWAIEERRNPGFHFSYHCVCVVPKDSPLKTFGDVLKASKAGQIECLFVNPLSASGRVLPEYVLREHQAFSSQQVRYSYSHTESLRLLLQDDFGKDRVAFVWDAAIDAVPELANRLRKIPSPQLDEIPIPHNVIVMRSDHRELERLRSAFASFQDQQGLTETRYLEDWEELYSGLGQWYARLSSTSVDRQRQPVSMDEIGRILLQNARSQPVPPRLAVVLSGGGAKCSYQVGAVCALEEELAKLRKQNPDVDLDINLIVGTSGGAINAVPIAYGVSSTSQGRKDFQKVWQTMDQREVVVPSWPVRANIGLWFALLEAGLLLWIVKRLVKNPEQRGGYYSGAVIGMAAFHAIAAYLHYSPWEWLGSFHLLHHGWLWLTFGTTTMCWFLLVLGVTCWLVHTKKIKSSRYLMISKKQVIWVMTVCLLGLPTVQIVNLLCFQATLSGGSGIEHAIAEKVPALISDHLERVQKPGLKLDSDLSDADLLKMASRQMIDGKQLQRDLVITANCIERTDKSLPTDLYFFAGVDKDQPTPFKERGISFHDYPQLLLDVVIGSGTIFPVFPAREIRDFPKKNERVELIDGGFAHNSPVEAAVLWGATHIVLVEATPARVLKRGNFIYNASSAFTHLHKQTQLVDVRSKQQVVVFTLQPSPPHICVLDFASNLIKSSIERGYRDAKGDSDRKIVGKVPPSQFYKELGAPVFSRVK